MITDIPEPWALATVNWLTAEQGGRSSGPPTAPVYAANCVFPLGEDAALVPGWPAAGEMFSLLLQKRREQPDGTWLCAVDFLVREAVVPYVVRGAPMLVMEGPKVVGRAVIEDVFPEVLDREES
jgi:hypothetical protein